MTLACIAQSDQVVIVLTAEFPPYATPCVTSSIWKDWVTTANKIQIVLNRPLQAGAARG